jgi:hypothetical protein
MKWYYLTFVEIVGNPARTYETFVEIVGNPARTYETFVEIVGNPALDRLVHNMA